jgi:hypothetical protein
MGIEAFNLIKSFCGGLRGKNFEYPYEVRGLRTICWFIAPEFDVNHGVGISIV